MFVCISSERYRLSISHFIFRPQRRAFLFLVPFLPFFLSKRPGIEGAVFVQHHQKFAFWNIFILKQTHPLSLAQNERYPKSSYKEVWLNKTGVLAETTQNRRWLWTAAQLVKKVYLICEVHWHFPWLDWDIQAYCLGSLLIVGFLNRYSLA